MKLYEIDKALADRLDQAEAYAAEHEGEYPEDLAMLIDGLEMAKNTKIGNLIRMIKNLNAEADMVEIESAKLAKRAQVCENKANRLKEYLSFFIHPGEKWSDETSKVSWRGSKSILVTNQEEVPAEYIKRTENVSVDKRAIKEDLKTGKDIPGIELVEKQSIQIK